VPSKPYPEWDANWDFREPEKDGDGKPVKPRALGPHRHVILVRHGQYDETHDDDARRVLTPLGRQQVGRSKKLLVPYWVGKARPGSVLPLKSRLATLTLLVTEAWVLHGVRMCECLYSYRGCRRR